MTYESATAAQLKAQQDVMNANFRQEKEPLLQALRSIHSIQKDACCKCITFSSEMCYTTCPWQQICNILKGVSHEI